MRKTLHWRLLATTAVAALSLGGAASAQVVITADETLATSVDIAAGLELRFANVLQVSDGTTLNATTVPLAPAAPDDDQVIQQLSLQNEFGGASLTQTAALLDAEIVARTRLNQSDAMVSSSEGLGGDVGTGAFSWTAAGDATSTVGLDANAGVVSLQQLFDTDDDPATAAGANALTSTANGVVRIDMDAPVINNESTIGVASILADALANDAQNVVSLNGGPVQATAGIASLQQVEAGAAIIGSTVTGVVEIELADTGDTDYSFVGTATIMDSIIGARSGLNTVANELSAGSASNFAEGTGAAFDLNPEEVAANGFVADYGIANIQTVDTAQSVTSEVVSATFNIQPGTLAAGEFFVEGNGDGRLALLSNEAIARTEVNQAVNRAFVTTGGPDGATVGIASVQTMEDAAAGDSTYTATVTEAVMTISNAFYLDDGDRAELSGNTVAAQFSGNEATNVISLTSLGALDSTAGAIVGQQTATNIDATATVESSLMSVTMNDGDAIAGAAATNTGVASLTNNRVAASAAMNTQTNVLQASGAYAGRASMSLVSNSIQSITGGTMTAQIDNAVISATSGSGDPVAMLASNTIASSATGNVASSTVRMGSSNGLARVPGFTR